MLKKPEPLVEKHEERMAETQRETDKAQERHNIKCGDNIEEPQPELKKLNREFGPFHRF